MSRPVIIVSAFVIFIFGTGGGTRPVAAEGEGAFCENAFLANAHANPDPTAPITKLRRVVFTLPCVAMCSPSLILRFEF